MVVIDEVQKLPHLLEVVHLLIEEQRQTKFVLIGSSARKLRRGGVNLLGGRAAQRSMHPFMASELGSHFRLEKALRQGMLPVVLGATNPDEDLRGLLTFRADYPESRGFLLYRGKDRLLRDGILCLPCEDFLLQLAPNVIPT